MAEDARKLLIVEDDRGLQKQLKWCFDGYDVLFAEDRESALGELRRHQPAVVLQDLGLPPDPEGVSEGFATLQEILQAAPATKVIVVTGAAQGIGAALTDRCVSLGARVVAIRMTLTAPGCGMGDILRQDLHDAVAALPGVGKVDVTLVFDPPWDPSKMSDEAKLQLNMF